MSEIIDSCPTMQQLQTLAIEQLGLTDNHRLIVMSVTVDHIIDQDDPGESEVVSVRLPKGYMLVGLSSDGVPPIDEWGIIQVPEDISKFPERATFKYQIVANTGYEASGEVPMISPNQYRQVMAALHGTLVEADAGLIADAESWRNLKKAEDGGVDDCWGKLK